MTGRTIKWIAALAMFALIGNVVLAQEFRIGSITVEGTQRIERATVLSYMTVSENSTASAAEINASLRALNETGLFEDVTIEPVGGNLIVRVVERPFVNVVAFEGNSIVADEILASAIRTRSRTVFSVAVVEADAQRMVDVYGRSGRLNAKVIPQIVKREGNRIDVVFEIDEGPITRVRKIVFLRNDAFSDSTLLDVIETREAAWFRLFVTTDRYDAGRVEADREALIRYYRGNGYADFEIVSLVSSLTEDGSGFVLTFTLDEGVRYTVSSISAVSSVSEVDAAEFEGFLDSVQPGDVYDGIQVERITEAILSEIELAGINFMKVVPEVTLNKEEATVEIVFNIDPAEQRYVERIDIEGNVRTLDSVIRREFTFVEGDALNRARIAETRRNLRGLGYFSSVEIEILSGSSPDRAVVLTRVTEQSTGSLSFGIGYSSSTKLGGSITLVERNLLGRGQSVRLQYTTDDDGDTYRFGLTEPYWENRKLGVSFDVYRSEQDDDDDEFKLLRQGFKPSVKFALSPETDMTIEYTIESKRTTTTTAASGLITSQRDVEEATLLSSLGYSFVWDQRNDPLEPRSGTLFNIRQEFAGLGGDVRYVSAETSARYFHPLDRDEKIIGTIALRAGAVESFGDYRLEYADRYKTGGTQFRGFEYRGLGPRDTRTDEALGGKFYSVLSMDVLSYSLLPEELRMTVGAFADIGTLFDLDETSYELANGDIFTVEDSVSFRSSVGLELQWNSPIGPMRFIFSRALRSETYDKPENFRFTVGNAF